MLPRSPGRPETRRSRADPRPQLPAVPQGLLRLLRPPSAADGEVRRRGARSSPGFDVELAWPSTLPYTFRSRLPSWPWLVRLYLWLPWLRRSFAHSSLSLEGGLHDADYRFVGSVASTRSFLSLRLGTPLFVWGVWAIMVLVALSFVVKYGTNLPAGDEWGYVPYITGEQPVTAEVLWAQHNEHRMPLPKILSLILHRLTHCDFRAGMVLNVIALGALAFAMIRVTKKLRRSMRYTDAFLPLALLQLGQSENLLWGFQVVFVTAAILASVFLLIIVRHPTRLGLRSSVLAGTCLLLLPLCGAQGVSLVPSLALWLGSAALLHIASGRSNDKRPSVLMLTFSIISISIVALYLRGYNQPSYHPVCPSLWAGLKTSLEFMSASFGPKTARFWPHAGWAMLGLLLSSGGLLMVAWWRRPQERFRVLGLLGFLGAMVSLSLAVGWGRSGLGPVSGFASRYVTLAVPLLCCVYFIWEIYAGRTLAIAAR